MNTEIAAMLTAGATVVLAVITAVYVIFVRRTLKAIELQRLDAARPIIAPANSAKQIRPASRSTSSIYEDMPVRYEGVPLRGVDDDPIPSWVDLYVRNVGAGPALNVRVRLESPAGVFLDEVHSGVRDLMPAEIAPVIQWQTHDQGPLPIDQSYVLVIAYDDIFGRHFEVSHEPRGGRWVLVKNTEVAHRQPHTGQASSGL